MPTLADYLLKYRTPAELAKELAQCAKDRAALLDRVDALKRELFWMQARERDRITELEGEVEALNKRIDFILSDNLLNGP